MEKETEIIIEEFKEYLRNIEYLKNSIDVLYWDMRVGIPRKAVSYRGDMLGYLSVELYKKETSEEMKDFIDKLSNIGELDDVSKAMVLKAKKDYDLTKKIPEEKNKEYVIVTSNGEAAWEIAKEKSDFSVFRPHLEKIVELKKEFIGYWGYEGTPYDRLLDFYEPGITVEKLDVIFGELKTAVVELLNKIKKSEIRPDISIFRQHFPVKDQKDFGIEVLKKIGFDFEAGRLDESVHPFTINFGNVDVRITTKYNENDFISALFGSIHEGGHAIYEQDIPDSLRGTLLAEGASMGVHESQSRFYENMVGRSRSFWQYFYPEAQKKFDQFKDVTLAEFYKGLNTVEPSLIRIEADELTYSLHIIIRYEIEKALFNGDLKVEELPGVWNKKYKEYLGVEPSADSEGVLQDVHWSGGDFGYFPSYLLGNLYGAQFLHKLLEDMPDFYSKLENGEFASLHNWLKENIHKYGAVYKPAELIRRVTGEELTSKYFIEYLNKKYAEIYELN